MEAYEGIIYGEYSKYTRLRIRYVVQPNIEQNHSVISLYLYAERTKNSHQYNNTGQAFWSLNETGNKYANFDWSASSSELALGSTTIVVGHNPDGTGAVTLSGYWYTGRTGSSYIPEALSVSQTITLKTIPRASTVSGGSGNIGANTTISVSRASDTFTHTLRYGFGTLSGTIATGVGTSYTWKIPTSFYEQIPDDPYGTGTIYCDTYSGSTLVGTKSVNFIATASKDSSRPTVTGTVVDTNSTTIALTGNANKLIKGKSTAKITVTPVARNSASIKSVTIDGVVTTNNTRTIANVTKASFPVVVIDSREYPNTAYSATASGGIVDYVNLSLNVQFFRPQPTTGEIQLTYSGNYFNGSFGAKQNSIGIEWHYRVKGTTTWTKGGTITPTISGNTIAKQTISLGTNYDYQTAYEFYIYAQDLLTTFSTTASVSVGMPVFYWGKTFFKTSVAVMPYDRHILGYRGEINENAHSFNTALTTGLYRVGVGSSSGVDGAPYAGTIYGILEVKVSDCTAWNKSNNWIWQRFEDTVGREYTRYAVNNSAFYSWKRNYKAKVLYNNTSGTTGTVTLNETAASFDYLEIFYKTNDTNPLYASIKVPAPNGRYASLLAMYSNSNNKGYLKSKNVIISGTSITVDVYSEVEMASAGNTFGTLNAIYITKVIGYK